MKHPASAAQRSSLEAQHHQRPRRKLGLSFTMKYLPAFFFSSILFASAPVKAECSNGICSLVPTSVLQLSVPGHPTPSTPALPIPTGVSVNASGTGYGYGAATNEQRNNSASYSTGGDITNMIVNPATASPSQSSISAAQVVCPGPMFTTGLSYLPGQANNGYLNSGNWLNTMQASANLTIPFGGAIAQCNSIAKLIEQQKAIDTQAGILALCVKTMEQGIDLTKLDPVVFPFAKLCLSVFKIGVPETAIEPRVIPAPQPQPAPASRVVRARG